MLQGCQTPNDSNLHTTPQQAGHRAGSKLFQLVTSVFVFNFQGHVTPDHVAMEAPVKCLGAVTPADVRLGTKAPTVK